MSICIEVYKKENDERDISTFTSFTFPLDMRVIDMRDEIMWKMYDSCKERKEHDDYYLEIENITDRLYKDFGKLFFDFGLLPKTIDNYPLSKMTSDGKVFQFQVYRMKKSELKDYVSLKRIWEMTEEEKNNFENKPVSAKKEEPSWVNKTWEESEDDSDEKERKRIMEIERRRNYERFIAEHKRNQNQGQDEW